MTLPRLREQNKQRNFKQIKLAANHLFEQKGYEETTTREIAEAAGIGTGTLFLYVKDKAQLLIFVYADAIEAIMTDVFASVTEERPPLLDALIQVFGPFFRLYERHPANARHFLKELLFYPDEQRSHQLFDALHEDFIERLASLVQHAQERGEIRQHLDPHLAARSFFALYFAVVTAWLGSFLLSDTAPLDQLRAVFDLQIKGMLP